jgi:hypothetical protein
MYTRLAVLAACALGAVACGASAPNPNLSQGASELVIECNYDPANPRERVRICHDTANSVGGTPTTHGPYRYIVTNENGCISGHSGHGFDFTIPPNAPVPNENDPCACVPEGARIETGACRVVRAWS